MNHSTARLRITDLARRKRSGEKIAMLTAYDATMARLLERAGVDVLLVGDSLGNVILGYEDTVPVTMDAMLHHTRAVASAVKHALVVADMPFLSYQASTSDAIRNAGRLLQEGGAAGVKIEGGRQVTDTMERMVQSGIPVMGHIGLTPQSVRQLGGYRYVGKTGEEADMLLADARALERAGAFALVLECVTEDVARQITAMLRIPTIGIGAGPHCDGQVLVSYDALGLVEDFAPKFVKRYADLAGEITRAVSAYVGEVREGTFPSAEHSVRSDTEQVRGT